jgi:tripartite-type tricarboxylate transporter receptor subunit TctC
VRALGTSALRRSTVLPDVPTIAEAGVPGYESTIWIGIMAPAGTPQAIVDKLNAGINQVIDRADVREAWEKQGRVTAQDEPRRVRQVSARRHREVGARDQGLGDADAVGADG